MAKTHFLSRLTVKLGVKLKKLNLIALVAFKLSTSVEHFSLSDLLISNTSDESTAAW